MPFVLWACDYAGFIYSGAEVASWCDDPDEACDALGLEDEGFETIRIVTGSAAEYSRDAIRLRAPSSHRISDLWLEWEVSGLATADVRERWRQAKLVVDLLNEAHRSGRRQVLAVAS